MCVCPFTVVGVRCVCVSIYNCACVCPFTIVGVRCVSIYNCACEVYARACARACVCPFTVVGVRCRIFQEKNLGSTKDSGRVWGHL